jgi:hypothetical protein
MAKQAVGGSAGKNPNRRPVCEERTEANRQVS